MKISEQFDIISVLLCVDELCQKNSEQVSNILFHTQINVICFMRRRQCVTQRCSNLNLHFSLLKKHD